MTDLSIQPAGGLGGRIDYDTSEARERVRKRYRADARFKLLGLSAIAIAGLFVVFLIGDIIRKGIPAFTEHTVALDVVLDRATLDAGGKLDPADLRAGDYQAVTRDALRAAFPDVKDRQRRRKLDGLLSTGAPDDVRDKVLAQPSLLGSTISMPLLLSDDADLYLKGVGTKVERMAGKGALNLVADGQTMTLASQEGGFAPALGIVKARARAALANAEAELARLARSNSASTALASKRAELEARIADFKKRASDDTLSETLDDTLPSLLIEVKGGPLIKLTELSPIQAKGIALLNADKASQASIREWDLVVYLTPEGNRRVSDQEAAWLESLKARGAISQGFATRFFANGDSVEPELAGIRGALTGSALTLLVTLLLCLPIGVGAAVYLEEFAPKNRFTDLLEVNINNLAAVPSIVFGLLGLAIFLNFFNLPRSAPLVGGLVLALLVLPTIIIASRAALKSVPPSIKEAALGVGASHQQAVFHHVLPLAVPGIMTGTIIGMAHALGETAPLLMIGMVAFIVEIPGSIVAPATVLPVQVFLWADAPELAFQAKTAAAIIVLLGFLCLMNGIAIIVRRRFERRW